MVSEVSKAGDIYHRPFLSLHFPGSPTFLHLYWLYPVILLSMQTGRSHIIIAHILCWLIFLGLPVIFLFTNAAEKNIVAEQPGILLYLLIFPAVFYVNTFLLLPKLFFKKKVALYCAAIIVLLAAVAFLRPYDTLVQHNAAGPGMMSRPPGPPPYLTSPPPNERHLPPGGGPQTGKHGPLIDIISVALFLLVIAIGIAGVMIKSRGIAVRRAAEAEAYRTKAELSSLKAQINPHFLFNTLNNIYSLALTKDENTPHCIMMLSNIMRYVTDEATQEMVPLQNEADCIHDFIELNKIRLGSKIRFNYSISGNMEGKFIAPLLLITFVENVFKYGVSNRDVSGIDIDLVTDDKKISFFCRNKLLPLNTETESTGVGIANTRKRLEYLYPGKHELHINDSDGYYTVTLAIYS